MKSTLMASLLTAMVLSATPALVHAADPDFGPNVLIFDEANAGDLQAKADKIFKEQERAQFGNGRYAIMFKPGKYKAVVQVGFYTHVIGLGKSPDDVELTGNLMSTAGWFGGNATCNFWRSAENMSLVPAKGNIAWFVSQGTMFRRMHIKGGISLADGGWSSGGFLGDVKVDGKVTSASQQQYLSRNTEMSGWSNGNWNMVFVGCTGAPGDRPPYTTVEKTPLIREKPFIVCDGGKWSVFVPALRKDSVGTSWSKGAAEGTSIPIDQFFIAKPEDGAAKINAALAAGKNLILTPGLYKIDDAIKVTRPDTVVIGIGYPTLTATKGNIEVAISDVDGVKISGILFEAGPEESPVLLQVGEPGSTKAHVENPTSLFDTFARSGGAAAGSCGAFAIINSSNVIGDNSWYWRADHGAGAAWGSNKTKNGLIVNGKDVTYYGLFVEHTQEYQTLWNGENGRTYFYQSELPYDPPSVAGWSSPSGPGYPSYKVAANVKSHQAFGLGIYAFFHGGFTSTSAIEAPTGADIKFHHMCTFHGTGSISHIFNDKGGGGGNPSRLDGN